MADYGTDEIPVATPVAPAPTELGEVSLTARRSAWPTVIGIFAVIIGGYDALENAVGAAVLLVLRQFADVTTSLSHPRLAQPKAVFEAMTRYSAEMAALSGVVVLLSIVLMVAGIALLSRRPNVPRLLVGWAILKIPVVVGATVVYVMYGMAVFSADSGGPDAPALRIIMALYGSSGRLVWGLAFPTFILIWFLRRPIRAEVAEWAGDRAA